jgi:hypothetical protein
MSYVCELCGCMVDKPAAEHMEECDGGPMPTSPTPQETRARELFAAEFDRDGWDNIATAIRNGQPTDSRAIRAISAALTEAAAQERKAIIEWLKQLRPNVHIADRLADMIEAGDHLSASHKIEIR